MPLGSDDGLPGLRARKGDPPWSEGVALPTVLWVLLIIVAMGTVFLILMSGSYLAASKQRHEQGAYYCAYSGIMYAKAKLDENPAWAPGAAGESIDITAGGVTYGRAFVTTAPGAGGSLIVTSQGRYGSGGKVLATRTIRATLNASGIVQWENL